MYFNFSHIFRQHTRWWKMARERVFSIKMPARWGRFSILFPFMAYWWWQHHLSSTFPSKEDSEDILVLKCSFWWQRTEKHNSKTIMLPRLNLPLILVSPVSRPFVRVAVDWCDLTDVSASIRLRIMLTFTLELINSPKYIWSETITVWSQKKNYIKQMKQTLILIKDRDLFGGSWRLIQKQFLTQCELHSWEHKWFCCQTPQPHTYPGTAHTSVALGHALNEQLTPHLRGSGLTSN